MWWLNGGDDDVHLHLGEGGARRPSRAQQRAQGGRVESVMMALVIIMIPDGDAVVTTSSSSLAHHEGQAQVRADALDQGAESGRRADEGGGGGGGGVGVGIGGGAYDNDDGSYDAMGVSTDVVCGYIAASNCVRNGRREHMFWLTNLACPG